mgnify:CR=1 FL=1
MDKHIKTIYGLLIIGFLTISIQLWLQTKAINDLNLKIESGKTLAIVGPTGSGKTTLINLLTRFYKVHNGKILISNNNINDLNLNVLRENIGLILQDTFLFSDTIFNNINFFF